MDPIAHTLVGATLAEAGWKKLSRYATPTLIIGANLPDIDVLAHFWGPDASLYFRRGWTHGILAMLVLPLLLAAVIWLWHRWRGRHVENPQPLRMGLIVLLSLMAVWSHPLLDWLNTYGVRLLMPFDSRWFYGDTLFIIDPWFWLLTAAGVVLARSGTYRAIAGWTLLAVLATVVVATTDLVPVAVKLVWLFGIAGIVALRWHRLSPALSQFVARAGLAILVVYIGVLYGAARLVEAVAAARFPLPNEAQANPVPGVPFAYRTVLVYDNHYRIVSAEGEVLEVARKQPDPVVEAALADDSIRGFVTWMRYPYWAVEKTHNGLFVRFWDLRYLDPGQSPSGIGFAEVKVE